MIIDTIKKKIENLKGEELYFKYNGSRNQIEEYYGTIEETYNSVFVIRVKDNKTVKSFSYNDIINKSLEFFI
jgi:uncharacterized protein Veg